MGLLLVLALLLGVPSPDPLPLTGPEDGVAEPAHDVPNAFAEVSAIFEARLLEAHPPGSPVEDLRRALLAEGFVLDGEGEASLTRPGFMCEMFWQVYWTERDGLIATIGGWRDGACL